MKLIWIVNHIAPFLILASTITGRTSIYTFTSFIGIPIGITSSGIWLRICVTTAGIRKYKLIIKKKKKKHDKIAKFKLNNIEVLISKAATDSVISHKEFVLINNLVKEYKEMKEEIKNLKP